MNENFDPKRINKLFDFLKKMSRSNRHFRIQVHYDGKMFAWDILVPGSPGAEEMEITDQQSRPEKETAVVPVVPKMVHRKS